MKASKSFRIQLQSLWTFQSVLNIFSDSPQVVNVTSFRIILNKVTKLVDLLECPKYLFDSPQVLENSTIFKIILNIVTKLEPSLYVVNMFCTLRESGNKRELKGRKKNDIFGEKRKKKEFAASGIRTHNLQISRPAL